LLDDINPAVKHTFSTVRTGDPQPSVPVTLGGKQVSPMPLAADFTAPSIDYTR